MSRDWQADFSFWARPPSKTEIERCNNAVAVINNAIGASDALKNKRVNTIPQGSYFNNTNVRQDSDVDVGIVCDASFFYDLPQGTTPDMFSITPASYQYSQFKNDVEIALVDYLERSSVSRGNKAFDIHETSYHVDADVVPFFEYRKYLITGGFIQGVGLLPDNNPSEKIINYPVQHHENGCSKNEDTYHRYKAVVRILKALALEMVDEGLPEGDIPGFLIECLVWNVPNEFFRDSNPVINALEILSFFMKHLGADANCANFMEVSGQKFLFSSSQKWTREKAFHFSIVAVDYILTRIKE